MISLAVSLISPLFNAAMWQPRTGIDTTTLAEMSPEELAEMGEKMQHRKSQGSGPIRPFFTSWLGMQIYLMTAGFFFVPLLAATLLVGYLGTRDKEA